MIFLCCESSTLLGSVAVFKDDQLLAFRESLRQGSHSDIINVYVQEVLHEAGLKLSDVDLFASGIGPGSFTGIRISLNTIKTFAYCFDKKVLGINSLENLAVQCEEKNRPIVTMINAFKNMVYIATYQRVDNQLQVLKAPEVVRVQNLQAYITRPVTVVGDGFQVYSKYFSAALLDLIVREVQPADEPRASSAGPLIIKNQTDTVHWSQLLPLYLRSSEAEENSQGIKFQPLI